MAQPRVAAPGAFRAILLVTCVSFALGLRASVVVAAPEDAPPVASGQDGGFAADGPEDLLKQERDPVARAQAERKRRERAGANGDDDERARAERCADLPEEERRKTEACKTEAERREDERQKRLDEIAERERPTRTSFLERIHLGGLWVPMQSGVSMFGVVGVHLVVANVGRVHLFGPPGVLLTVDNTSGKRLIRPAFTWGVSIYLTDFRVPVANRGAELYLNLTRVWMTSRSEGEASGLSVAGLSMTWKRD